MKFPKNVAIECSTWKQVKKIKKKFGVEDSNYNAKNYFIRNNTQRYLRRDYFGHGILLFDTPSFKEENKTIHANEYLKINLKDLTDNDAVHCPTYEDVLKLKELADEAGFKTSGRSYTKDGWGDYKKEYCIRPIISRHADREHYKLYKYKIHKLSKFIKTKTPKAPSKKDLQKAYNEGCSDVQKVLKNLYPDEFDKTPDITIKGNNILVNGMTAGFPSNNEPGSIFLSGNIYKWEIKEDEDGDCFVKPTKK